MRFFRPLLSLIASFVFVAAIALPVAADARTAVIIGDSQAQGLQRPLTTALAGYDVEVTGQSSHAGKGLRWFLDNNTISSMVNSRNPQLVILIIGGNDDVQTSGASRTAYETKLRQAYNDAHARGADVVWIGPATSRDEGVQERHDRTATVQSSYVPSLGARWIDGRPGSAAGPFQQETNPGSGESQIRSRNSHLTGEGYRAWACALAPGIAGGGTPSSCPTVSEADQVFPDAVADVDSPSAAVADSSAGYSATCDPSDDAPVPITLGVNIGGIQQVTGLPEYINTVYRYLVSIILVVAIVMVVYGGFLYLTGAAGIGSIQRGKQIIRDALIGMVVVLAAYSILQTINPSTTQFRLNPESIECVGISASSTARDSNADEGGNIRNCVADADCRDGRVCLRTAYTASGLASLGQCSQGRANELCRCAACDLREVEGRPTNNNGTGRVECQEGTCRQAGTGSILDDSASGNWVCNSGADGSQCNNATEPPVTCASGYICEQKDRGYAGRCVAGDHRDYALDPRPVCSTLGYGPTGSDRYYEETNSSGPFEGGCNRISGDSFSAFCITNRYRCSNSASNRNVCAEEEFARMFAITGQAYNTGASETWDFNRAHETLKPWNFARFGCRKPLGGSCASDAECPSMCVGGRCVGFCALVPSTPDDVPAGAPPSGVDKVCTGCGDDTWSGVWIFATENSTYYGHTAAEFATAFGQMTIEKAACYPRRASGSQCDFNGQCAAGLSCVFEPGFSPADDALDFTSIQSPLDMTSGLGTCR
jgi:lysophospholipase L1-like esterase